MAALAATSACAATCFVQRTLSSPVQTASKPRAARFARRSVAVCSASNEEVHGLPKLAAAVTSIATLGLTHPALALVDERMSTEGSNLALGINSSSLTITLLGVGTLVWIAYQNYTGSLPPSDDDSGLGL
eukprot:TRINITY_DN22937_c0_g1_i1.p1 TRINITY_DN22937_c0_g1~~TRINITY_DN22937_c0_g1_i1.p1  ORF type:complete len:130 (+),score=29.90 TRINITY_DN22937_c0_g1_i1:218-607(+)